MKKIINLIVLVVSLILCSNAYAVSLRLTIESYAPATFSTKSTVINVADSNDQLEISRQAVLFSLSSEGWNLENLGLGGVMVNLSPPTWIGNMYYAPVLVPYEVPLEIEKLFGYELTEMGGINGPHYNLFFHTDEWVERLAHNIGETLDNYGVISGGMEGDTWHQCPVTDWGRFYVEEIQSIPEPITIILLFSSFSLFGVFRIKINT